MELTDLPEKYQQQVKRSMAKSSTDRLDTGTQSITKPASKSILSVTSPSGTKYGNKKTTVNGVIYDSKAEAFLAEQLDLQERAGQINCWFRQISIPLVVDFELIARYVVDFLVVGLDGVVTLIEVKGVVTPSYRLKRKLFESTYLKQHPSVVYQVVKRQGDRFIPLPD